jgi:hypothetical protein
LKNILFLFGQDWDAPQLARVSAATDGAYRFHHEGFDLFRFPSNVNLLVFDIYRFVDRLIEKYRHVRLDAVLSTHEQFGALAAALLAERLGLPSMSLEAVLNAQHKLVARERWQTHAPHLNVPYAAFPYTVRNAIEIALPFPFYAKPVKAAYSILARRVDSFAALRAHLTFHPWEKFIIKRLVRPFNDVVAREAMSSVNGHWMLAEQLIDGFHVNVDGFVENGKVQILGIVDAVMFPGTDAFMRWEYPSRLPELWQRNLRDAASACVRALSLNHGLFNVELRVCTHSGECKVIEVNPRMATQFSDLYEAVDGVNLHALALSLALGESVSCQPKAGKFGFATSFVYRRFDGRPQPHFPDAAQQAALKAFAPESQLVLFPKTGAELKRESKWLSSYRYACLNLAANSEAELMGKYREASKLLGFAAPE